MSGKTSWPQAQEQLYLRATQGSKGSEHPQNVAAGLAYSSMQYLNNMHPPAAQAKQPEIFDHM